MGLSVGDSIPTISIPDETGELFELNKFTRKQALIAFFYAKNFILGWVDKAFNFRDKYEEFKD